MIDKMLNDKNKNLMFLASSIILLNALDGVLTIAWIETGRAIEINPLMGMLIDIHPVLFMCIKILLASLGTLLIWRFRDRSLAVASLYLCVAAYSLLMLYHVGGLIV